MSIEHLLNKVHCGDCLELMKQLPDKCVDLVLTDPPYGIGEANGKNHSRGKWVEATKYTIMDWDNAIPSKEIFNEILRVSKNQIIFGGNYFGDYLGKTNCWIVWDKDNGDSDFADCELAWTSFRSAVRKVKWKWQGMLQEKMDNKDKRYHPTQKPIGVLKWILDKYSQSSDIIFDPFMGSGTTAIASYQLGRRWFGCEISPEYCAIANKRIENEIVRLLQEAV